MEIIADMTRQYKSVFEDMTERINQLEARKSNNDAEIRKLEEQKYSLND